MVSIYLGHGIHTTIDNASYDDVMRYTWYVAYSKGKAHLPYAVAHIPKTKKLVRMHRLVLGLTDPYILCDHIDGNTLNNQTGNLRTCTRAENGWNARLRPDNRQGFKGVRLDARRGCYYAEIQAHNKRHFLGSFATPEEAHQAYCAAAKTLHGTFARSS